MYKERLFTSYERDTYHILVPCWLPICIGNLGLQHGRHLALGFMQIVPDRTAATLLPILQQHVSQGSVVHSDQWASYNQVGNLPNVPAHGTVNHSMEFVSPSGIHTQNIVLLEPDKNEAQMDEGVCCERSTQLLGWVHVAGKIWKDTSGGVEWHHAWYCNNNIPFWTLLALLSFFLLL